MGGFWRRRHLTESSQIGRFTSRAEERAAYAQGTVMTKVQSLASSRALDGDEIVLGK